MTLQKTAVLSLLAALAVAAHPALSARGGQQRQQEQAQVPVFRSAVTLVPIDVRILDNRTGRPVTDMRREEFTLIEDGVRQEVRHFSLQGFASDAPDPGSKLTLQEETVSFEPQTNRIFLIVLGRGKLMEPSKAVDALLRFVRERLLPRDQVAVFAYNRATTFSTDHEQIARVIERFRKEHEEIEYQVALQMAGLTAVYGAKLIPKSLQGRIDKMFEGSGLLASQRVDAGATADKRIEKDAQRQVDAQFRKQMEAAGIQMTIDSMNVAQRLALTTRLNEMRTLGATDEELAAAIKDAAGAAGWHSNWNAIDEIHTQMFADLSLEEFVSATAQTLQDLGNIYAGINYLKHFEGEKHLVFLTEKGLTMPRLEEDVALAQTANDARVALDTIETGGIYVAQPGNEAGVMPDGLWNQTSAFKTLRNISEFTGGVSSIAENGMKAMERIDDVTRATYLLGYYPTNARWDGSYRKVQLRTSRPGVTVLYRQGYYGRTEILSFNRRDFITNDRVSAAAGFRREITDIKVKLDAGLARAEGGQGYVLNVSLNVDPSSLAFTFVEGVHKGRITVGLFFFNESGRTMGGGAQHAELELNDADFKSILSKGIPYKMTVPIDPGVRRIRAVVYDFKADLVGSRDTFVR
jgi:VWFA-related protein